MIQKQYSAAQPDEKFLTMNNLNEAVKNVQYAVRGKVVIRAGELENDLKQVFKTSHENQCFHFINSFHCKRKKIWDLIK